MKVKVADYVADFFAGNDISQVFMITGGGIMHLNDALGHHKQLHCLYNHHEQASSMAAEAYYRIYNKIPVLCVTSGPGATNVTTGVAGAYIDSVPMIVLSGQVRYDTTAHSTGLNLRAMGEWEFDIVPSASSMTKYCEMVIEPKKIRYCLEKALYIAKSGRPGPCWLVIPVNVQGSYVETDELEGFDEREYEANIPPRVEDGCLDEILDLIKKAKRPVFYAGNGIRIAGAYDIFRKVADKLNIPVVTGWNCIDLIPDDHPLYAGRGGMIGTRPGNFAAQNSDLLLSVGSRLSIRQVGYNHKAWAREAYTIVVDADKEELKKPTVHVSMPVWADAKEFLEKLDKKLEDKKFYQNVEWLEICQNWKKDYPIVTEEHYKEKEPINVYAFVNELSRRLPENQIIVSGNGTPCMVGSQACIMKEGQRYIMNAGLAAMGYGLPAAVGASVAAPGRSVILLDGDGSIQMNIQELQTVVHHKLPIKIFLINNDGYHSIRQTQMNFFGDKLVGIGSDSGDLSFPDMSKIAAAYGIEYRSCCNFDQMLKAVDEVIAMDGPVLCEVYVSKTQKFEPKSATKKLEDGSLVSAPLEDMAPFLSKEELEKNMFIPLMEK
jgi:acetolactate synthase-1/2/3 large subunit